VISRPLGSVPSPARLASAHSHACRRIAFAGRIRELFDEGHNLAATIYAYCPCKTTWPPSAPSLQTRAASSATLTPPHPARAAVANPRLPPAASTRIKPRRSSRRGAAAGHEEVSRRVRPLRGGWSGDVEHTASSAKGVVESPICGRRQDPLFASLPADRQNDRPACGGLAGMCHHDADPESPCSGSACTKGSVWRGGLRMILGSKNPFVPWRENGWIPGPVQTVPAPWTGPPSKTRCYRPGPPRSGSSRLASVPFSSWRCWRLST
jgi:hypothetical protein